MPLTRICVVIGATVFLTFAPGQAQADQPLASQPYAQEQEHAIKSLSDEEIASLRAGQGMGLAKAAELNGFPGPRHVLEHAEALQLTPSQRNRTQEVFRRMQSEAIHLGELLIGREGELDRLFASKSVDPAKLDAATSAVAAIQGQLRAEHLRAHLLMMDVLTTAQIRRYGELRGYGSGETSHDHRAAGHSNH